MPKTLPLPAVAPDLVDRVRARFRDFPLTRTWGLAIDALEPGRARLSLLPGLPTTNAPGGVVNGGVLATLGDIACALALGTYFDGQMPFATSDLHIRYLEPADSKVQAAAAVLRASTRNAILECQLTCGARLVGLVTAHFVIRPGAGHTAAGGTSQQ